MIRRRRDGHDPFWDDGTGARQTHQRLRIESLIAFGLAIAACGVAAGFWLRIIAASVGLGLG